MQNNKTKIKSEVENAASEFVSVCSSAKHFVYWCGCVRDCEAIASPISVCEGGRYDCAGGWDSLLLSQLSQSTK
jgi:hypothetical protein